MDWFRNRKKNRKEWFRVDDGAQILEGTKLEDGSLQLVMRFMGESSSIKVSRSNSEKVLEWLIRCYPRSGNVIHMGPKLSVLPGKTDTSRGPTSS